MCTAKKAKGFGFLFVFWFAGFSPTGCVLWRFLVLLLVCFRGFVCWLFCLYVRLCSIPGFLISSTFCSLVLLCRWQEWADPGFVELLCFLICHIQLVRFQGSSYGFVHSDFFHLVSKPWVVVVDQRVSVCEWRFVSDHHLFRGGTPATR